MPPITDLAKASSPISTRLKTAEDVHRLWLRQETPVSVGGMMLDYAIKHDLELSERDSDLYPVRLAKEGEFAIAVKWPGIERICRATGLWMPGKSDCRIEGGTSLIVTATCYARFNTHSSSPWLEISAFARLASYFERDMSLDDPKQAKAAGEWAEAPEVKLEEIAQYLAALKVFGDFVAQHNFPPGVPKSILHGQLIRRRMEAGEERAAAAAKS